MRGNLFREKFLPFMAADAGGGYGGSEPDIEDDFDDDDDLDDGSDDDPDDDPEFDDEGSEEEEEEEGSAQEEEENLAHTNTDPSPDVAQIMERAAELERQNQYLIQSTVGGQVNPYTNKPITNFQEFQEYVEAESSAQLEQMGMPADYLKNLIDNHPAIQQANKLVESQKNAALNAMIAKELTDIQKMNPDIKTAADLKKLPDYEVFDTLVKGGMHINKAYQTYAKMTGQSKTKGTDNKSHLKAFGGKEGSQGDGPSKKEMEMFRAINPGCTDKEIKAFYKKHKKED